MTKTLTLDDLAGLKLARGGHPNRKAGVCFLEAVAWFAGEKHTDRPSCVDPALAAFGRAFNDGLPDEQRQRLKGYIDRVVDTAGDGKTERRVWKSVDTLIRQIAPLWLDAAGYGYLAHEVRSLDEVRDPASSRRAYDALKTVAPAIDASGSPAAFVAERTTSWARAYAYDGTNAGLFALHANGAAGSANVGSGAALARSRGLDVPSGTLEASDAVLFDLLDRMITVES